MNQKEFDAVIKLPANIRYEYFIKKVADYQEVWGLYHEGWATAEDDNSSTLIPFFPHKEFAESSAKNEWRGCKPKHIDLDEFIEKWIPGMKKDGIKVSIFPTDKDSAVVDVQTVLRDLEEELEEY